MSENAATVSREIPMFFPADGETLFGILTNPADEAVGTAVIVLPGGSTPMTTDRNRISVRLCRRFAGQGYHALRFDYHGAGESTGSLASIQLERPFVQDVEGAVRSLATRGITTTVLLGSCFGARTALSAAPTTAGVRGVVLISVPVRDHPLGAKGSKDAALEWSIWRYMRRTLSPRVMKGLFDPRHRHVYRTYAQAKWQAVTARGRRSGRRAADEPDGLELASPHFLAPLASVVERGIPVLLVFGTSEEYRRDFDRAKAGRLGEILRSAGPLIDIEMIPGKVHGFRDAALQDAVIDVVSNWLCRLEPPGSSDTRQAKQVTGLA